ncbi:MAG: DUF2142 domain-containing protein [Eubacteriales bacterium]|nr:DUF2142 domain-containing protein [Eubacteriales bacterium]
MVLFFMTGICGVVYKAQIADKLGEPLTATMKLLHKENGVWEMSADAPMLVEEFLCEVPQLVRVSLEYKAKNVSPEAVAELELADAETEEIYASEAVKGSKLSSGKLTLHLKEKGRDLEGKHLRLTVRLVDAGSTKLRLTDNLKWGIVDSFNGDPADKTNVISEMKYGNGWSLRKLYAILCVALLIFAALGWYLLIIRRATLPTAYVPLALVLGLIFNFVITVHGVPDEPWHISTAYRYSNLLMGVGDTDVPNTIYMRKCDAVMTDMLANRLEGNSYDQLRRYLLERPQDTELVLANYVKTDYLAPTLVYVPTILGITTGRLLGLSALLTLSLGRIFALIVYVLLTRYAILLIPYGKHALSAVLLLPVSMQQATSASYDVLINAFLILFVALCFCEGSATKGEYRFRQNKGGSVAGAALWYRGRRFLHGICLLLLMYFIAITKGGVYTPLYLLLLFPLWRVLEQRRVHNAKRLSKKWIAVGAIILAALAAIVFRKFWPMFSQLLHAGTSVASDGTQIYSVEYFVRHPQHFIYVYWETFVRHGDQYLRGMLGGMLSWLDIKIPWMYLIGFFACVVLLAHVEGDRFEGDRKRRMILGLSAFGTVVLILLSMLLAYTSTSREAISGVQGRYFFAIWPLLLFLLSNTMIHVKKKQGAAIAMCLLLLDVMAVLSAVTQVL